MVPLRDVVAVCLDSYFPPVFARVVGYGFLGTCFFLFFFIPFLCHLKCKQDMVLLGGWVLCGLLLFSLRRPEEINAGYGLLLAKSILMAFPYYIVARSLKDYGMLETALYRSSFVINIAALIAMRYRVTLDGGYSMGMAYAVLPGAIIASRMFLRWPSILVGLNAGASLFALIYCGTRGPAVCYVLFCIYEMICHRMLVKKNVIKKILLVGAVGLMGLAGVTVVLQVKFSPEEYIENNRFFVLARNDHLFTESQRDRIRMAGWETLEEHPFLGVGLLEDRVQILQRGNFLWKDKEKGYEGYYSHFVFLDWILEYGFFVGILISLLALCAVHKIFFMPQGSNKSCLEIFFFSGCVPLLFSGIWHEERLFYIVLGMLASIVCTRGQLREG